MASNEDTGLFMPDEYDAEIKRLETEKKARIEELKEPKAQRRRQVRRAQIIGRGFVRGRYLLDKALLGRAREVAGENESWLFGKEILKLDGWTVNQNNGEWTPPALDAAYLDDDKKALD